MIEGFIHKVEEGLLAKEASRVPENGCIVEVGSYYGKSTSIMAAAANAGVKICAVDAWDNRGMGTALKDTYEKFIENMKPYPNVKPIRGNSPDVGAHWAGPPIDLLFIDGGHDYDTVYSDMMAWVKWLKNGGVLMMHDFTEPTAGVRRAYNAYWPVIGVNPKNTIIVGSIVRTEKP